MGLGPCHDEFMGRLTVLALALCALLQAQTDYASARRKIGVLQGDQAPAGSVIILSAAEVNAYVRREAAKVAPDGLTGARVVLGVNRATGYASVDFPKLRQAQGKPMNRLLAWIVGGERPVRVDARIQSGQGKALVDVKRVEVSGIVLSGGALDWLIHRFLWTYYPEAKVGKTFELAHQIERLEITPAAVRVVVGQ